jgi:hypothetical protein
MWYLISQIDLLDHKKLSVAMWGVKCNFQRYGGLLLLLVTCGRVIAISSENKAHFVSVAINLPN